MSETSGAVKCQLPAGRLLVASPERIDDACFSIPAVRSLAVVEGVERVYVLCRDQQRSLWRTVPGVEVFGYRKGSGVRAIRAEIETEEIGFSSALVWEKSQAAQAIRKAKIAPRFGPALDRLSAELTMPVELGQRPGPIRHRVRDFLLLVKALGAKPFAAEYFEPVDLGVEVPPDSLALVPDSDFGPSYLWRLERWIETARRAAEILGRPVTVIDRGDGPQAAKLAEALGELAVLEETDTMADDLYLLARHRIVLCVDGGISHLASHVGSTCVVLFGPAEPAWKRPLGKRHRVLRRHVACSPCLHPVCPLDRRCMDAISADSAVSAIEFLLQS